MNVEFKIIINMKHIVIASIIFLSLFISCNGQDKKSELQQIKNNKRIT